MSESTRPVLIGASQFSQRDVRLETARNPLDMALQIAREVPGVASVDSQLSVAVAAE